MLFADYDDYGCIMYTVCNDQGLCLIRTSNGLIARYVHILSRGVAPDLRLTVGGDPGTRQARHPVFHHVRRYSR